MNTVQMKLIVLASLLGVFFIVSVTQGQDAASKPAASSAPTVDERMTPFLKIIKESKDPATVAAAYSKASAIQGDNIDMQQLYVRRMLEFGLPQYAYFQAVAIVRQDPKNGMAWGVIGYNQGKKGELGDAFSATIRAAGLLPNDTSVLNNAGQLLAWYENTLSAPDVADNVKRTIDQMKAKWAQNEAFTKSYNRVMDAYNQRDKMDQALADKIGAAEAAMLATQRNLYDVDARLQSSLDDINAKLADIEYIRRSMTSRYVYCNWPTYWPIYQPPMPGPGPCPGPGPGPRPPPPPPPPNQPCADSGISFWGQWGDFGLAASFGSYSCWGYPYFSNYWAYPIYSVGISSFPYSPEYARQIRREVSAIADLRNKVATLQADKDAALADYKNKRQDLDVLKSQIALLENILRRNFRWDPPMIDGVLYPEADSYVMTAPKEKLPSDPEGEAEGLYRLADLYFANDNVAKAREYLDKIMADYPNTAAVKKANELLAKINARVMPVDKK